MIWRWIMGFWGSQREPATDPLPQPDIDADDLKVRYEKEDRMLEEIDRQFMRAREALRLAERRSQERH
jgi:hypothetical protein